MQRAPFSTCGECQRWRTAENCVPTEVVPGGGEGKVLIIVGQDPGETEDARGRPWVGPSGRFVRTLVDVYYPRYAAFVLTNACRCYSDHPPTHEEIVACLPNLLQDLQHGADVIACGRAAEKALKMAGVDHVYVPHPSVYLRTKQPVQRWISLVQARVAKREEGFPVEFVDSLSDLKGDVLSVDAEFSDLSDPYLISVSDGVRCVTLERDRFHELRYLNGKKLIAHNAVVEAAILSLLGITASEWVDTLSWVRAYDDRISGDLKTVSAYLLGYTYPHPTTRALRKGEVTDELRLYNARDAITAYRLYRVLSVLEEHPVNTKLLSKLPDFLVRMGLRGIKVDRDEANRLLRSYEQKSADLEERLREHADINWLSVPQVLKYFQNKGLQLRRCDKATLEVVEHEEAKLLLEYRHSRKMLSTYLRPLSEVDRVRFLLSPSGTETGRLSFLWGSVNIQTIPDEVRSVFVPDEGHVWIKADYKTHEVRVLAWLAETPVIRSNVLDWSVEPRPLHEMLAHEDPYDAISYIYSHLVEDKKLLRDVTKMTFLALMYGAGAERIYDQALKMGVSASYEQISEVVRYLRKKLVSIEHLRNYLKKYYSDYIVWPPLFRRRVVSGYNFDEYNKMLINTPTQGAAADICTLAALKIAERYPVLLILHDEIDVQVPKDEVEEAVNFIRETMLVGWASDLTYLRYLPDLQVDVSVRDRWEAQVENLYSVGAA